MEPLCVGAAFRGEIDNDSVVLSSEGLVNDVYRKRPVRGPVDFYLSRRSDERHGRALDTGRSPKGNGYSSRKLEKDEMQDVCRHLGSFVVYKS